MNTQLKLYQLDAFASRLFSGNPAAVVHLSDWLDKATMLRIAAENNLSETAFVVSRAGVYELRWFTPTTEVDLCGHATLACAHVIFTRFGHDGDEITFHSRSGPLRAVRGGDKLYIDLPVQRPVPTVAPQGLHEALGLPPAPQSICLSTPSFVMLEVDTADDLLAIDPDFRALAQADPRGVIVTAVGNGSIDFVSRFFAPAQGIDEDPVTGSAHCALAPFWSERLGKTRMLANQLSSRGGRLDCELQDDRVLIGGTVVDYLEGMITL